MDGSISLHLPSVIPDSYYDISNHGSGYQPFQPQSSWTGSNRDEPATRGSWTAGSNRDEQATRGSWPAGNREDATVRSSWNAGNREEATTRNSWTAGNREETAPRGSWTASSRDEPATRNSWSTSNQAQGSEFETNIRYPSEAVERRECTVTGTPDTLQTTGNEDGADGTREEDWSTTEEHKDDDRQTDKSSPRQSQVALTLQWLSENYERAEGVCLPRCVLYQHYLDFCKKMKFTPAGAATFGKIIRQRFPKLTTRRLGTRGQSKYHYYGIGIKESSIYYHSVYSGKGLTRFSGIKLKTEGSSRKYSLSSKTGTLLPDFPNADNLILPPGTDLDKMRTFIMMYRTHCQRILDTIISANFEEVQNFLVHFWQGMPEHLLHLLTCDLLPDIVALCDSILYKVLLDVLIPSTIQELPNSLHSEMHMFSKRLPFWIETSMETVPEHLQHKKLEVAKSFIQNLRRQSSFVHLAQTTRAVTSNQETLGQMVKDISDADFVDICSQAGFMDPSANPKFCMKMQDFYTEFKELLGKQSPIESYTEWIDDIVEKYVLLPSGEDVDLFKRKAAEFLLHWGAFSGLLMRELTLQNAQSFASIHLVHLMLDEYAFLVIETQHDQEVEKCLQRAVQQHMRNAEEIHTKAVVRNGANKAINSPKCKKRRHPDDYDESSIQQEDTRASLPGELHQTTPNDTLSSTAFTRPFPVPKDPSSVININTNNEVNNSQTHRPQTGTGAISVPPVKPYQPYSNSFDRPTYLPQFGLGSYPDYVGHNPSFGNSRLTNYSEAYPTVPFTTNLTSVGGNYWADGRSSHSFSDPYQHYNYNYNKLNATYDSLNKTTLLRTNAYQDTINRQALDSSRPYYRGPHDNIQVAPALGSYGANFMDIAPSASQYCYQDDLFPGSMSASFAKPFLSGPFR